MSSLFLMSKLYFFLDRPSAYSVFTPSIWSVRSLVETSYIPHFAICMVRTLGVLSQANTFLNNAKPFFMEIEIIFHERDFVGVGAAQRGFDIFDSRVKMMKDFILHFFHFQA